MDGFSLRVFGVQSQQNLIPYCKLIKTQFEVFVNVVLQSHLRKQIQIWVCLVDMHSDIHPIS